MEEKQFYSALKTLEQLEHTFLPQVKGYVNIMIIIVSLITCVFRYTFSDLLVKEIPKLRKSIEDQSNDELKVCVCVCVL